ncbi:hypothetical protein BBP40_002311 [Aspergillus hancockii]|nr:hypothetical protein BBP40_002311 [Aspergillus hancockii]
MIFLRGQASLMAETKRLIDEISILETHIDLLFLSFGFLPFLGRQGINIRGLGTLNRRAYYSLQTFIRSLLPLLRAAVKPGAHRYSPRIVNILGTGFETATLFLDDLTLKDPGQFSVPSYAGHCATMTSVSLKRLAEQLENKDIVILHHHPGIVATNMVKKS